MSPITDDGEGGIGRSVRERMWYAAAEQFYVARADSARLGSSLNAMVKAVVGQQALIRRLAGTVPTVARFAENRRDARLDRMESLGRRLGDLEHARRGYREVFGCDPDLESPKTFNEKIQVIKLGATSPLQRQCADKIAVRDYVKERVSGDILTPLILVTETADDITQERIEAEQFVVRANHDCGSTHICFRRNAFDWSHVRRRLRRAIARDFSYVAAELQYRDLPRRIMVEAYVHFQAFSEFRIFCFSGRPEIVSAPINRLMRSSINFYDRDWSPLYILSSAPWSKESIAPPRMLKEMLDVATRLSAPFPFARIDLFASETDIRFGEVTLTPGGGLQPFSPPLWEEQMGAMIDLGGNGSTLCAPSVLAIDVADDPESEGRVPEVGRIAESAGRAQHPGTVQPRTSP